MMLLTPDHDDLAPVLQRRFRTLVGHTKDAVEVNAVFHQIIGSALHILCDLLCDWNRDNFTCRLPPEVLTSCISFLPFEDRVRASHVSRAWRAAALAFPALWSSISIYTSSSKAASLLDMALSRSGDLPVDIKCCGAFPFIQDRAIERLVERHMHRMRSISWMGRLTSSCFMKPAPLLEDVSCVYRSNVTELDPNFLGGKAGRLRSLHLNEFSLPQRCPALSTVTRFTATIPFGPEYRATLSVLFTLLPRLESLNLMEISCISIDNLPRCSAPRTLTELSLHTRDRYCNLLPLFTAWVADAEKTIVCLSMDLRACSDLSPVLRGAKEFVLAETFKNFTTLQSGKVTLVLAHGDGASAPVKTGRILADHGWCFRELRWIKLPLGGLEAFVSSGSSALPSLRVLSLDWQPASGAEIGEHLPHVQALHLFCPLLETINISIRLNSSQLRSPDTREHWKSVADGVRRHLLALGDLKIEVRLGEL